MVGETVGHYVIVERLGEGGMGTVFRARDTLLDRTVALKVLHADGDADSTRRLVREARAASALNHPGSVTIHAVEQQGDRAFIVMEHVAGVPLDRAIPPGGVPLDVALRYACDITDAVAAAHAQGIVHRDLKPGNVMVTPDGRVKVLDFGLSRRTLLPDDITRAETVDATIGGTGIVLGTPAYMAPEQIEGKPATDRSDVFALGLLIFQLITGISPFRRDSTWASLNATMQETPPSLSALTAGVPPRLAESVARCLAKNSAERPSARELHEQLQNVRREMSTPAIGARSSYRWVAVAAVVAVVIVGAAAYGWSRIREGRLRWVRDTAIPEINRLGAAGDPVGAYRLALRARDLLPNDPVLSATWESLTNSVPLSSEPPGASVSIRSLDQKDEGWISIGTTPATVLLPLGQMRWRYTLNGYDTLEIVPNPVPMQVSLTRNGSAPPGMVKVPAGPLELPSRQIEISLPEFWIDANEVTNRQFKEFVDRGGYRTREYWPEPFVSDGRTLTWDEAMERFRDPTGQPGPATWELGAYPSGQDDWPVHGVSWYEASAYARFAGKSLPTIYHWYRAAGVAGPFSDVLRFSNFSGTGPQRVGTSGSLGPFGTRDMAGNVKEWTWNATGSTRRFILGGAWYEPPYQAHDEDAGDPMDRRAGRGFRCVKYAALPTAELIAPVATLARDPALLKPVGEELYQAYRRLYDYDRRPLEARIDERDESSPHYVVERVSFTAPYGDERLPVMLFLPRDVQPPYQVLIYFPGSDAVRTQDSRTAYLQLLQFLPRSGRAVAFPIYQQTFERRRKPSGPNFAREISIQRGQDLRRTVDYLESRTDIDKSRIAFYGLSLGAQLGPVYLAIEPRLRGGVLLSGGFETWNIPPETDPVNFAPRVRQPVLMVNGREDFDLPYDTAQLPLLRALGTKPEEKQHVVLEGGHVPPRPQEVFKEILNWLDRWLGPVGR